jgi:DNA-binding transcriptional LysR family regulator
LPLRYPRLGVSLELDDRVVDIVGEGLDVVIRIGGLADSSAMMRKLADNRRILVAAPVYLNRAGRPATPADVAGHEFLRYGTTLDPWRLRGPKGATASLAAVARLRVDNGDTVHDWALAGLGIMLKSEVDVMEDLAAGRLERVLDLAAGRLERVLPDWDGGEAPIVALYPSAQHAPLKTRLMLDELKGHIPTVMA